MLDTSPFFIVLPYKINFFDYQTKIEKTKAILLKRSFWRFYWCIKLSYILRSKKLDSFAKRSTKIYAVFWYFFKKGTIKENFHFFIKNIEKTIKTDIFLLSSTSSIQPCRKRSKKKDKLR